MATIREIAEKYYPVHPFRPAPGVELLDANDEDRANLVAALREFGEELAKLCEAEAVDFAATKDEGDRAYNLATEHCAEKIRFAIRESL